MDDSGLVIAYGMVYIGSTNHYLYAFDADSGQVRWRQDINLGMFYTPPAVANGYVYIANGARLKSLDARTGELVGDLGISDGVGRLSATGPAGDCRGETDCGHGQRPGVGIQVFRFDPVVRNQIPMIHRTRDLVTVEIVVRGQWSVDSRTTTVAPPHAINFRPRGRGTQSSRDHGVVASNQLSTAGSWLAPVPRSMRDSEPRSLVFGRSGILLNVQGAACSRSQFDSIARRDRHPRNERGVYDPPKNGGSVPYYPA